MITGSKTRVLFIESGTEPGGAQVALLNLLENLDREAIEPHFVSLAFGNGGVPGRVSRMGIPVLEMPPARFRNVLQTASRIRELVRIIRQKSVDVVFCNSGHPLLFGRPAAALGGRPCIWWVHGYFPDDPMKGHIIGLAERLLQADLLLANSQYTARMLQRVFPEHSRIRVLNPCVDTGKFRALPENGRHLRSSFCLEKETPIVGLFGRLHPFKGQLNFLQAGSLLRRRGVKCHLLLVGGRPFNLAADYEWNLREFVAQSGLEGAVSFLGHREDTNELMNACDVVVHASVEPEPWGLVVAEAMAAGRPVIAAAAGGPSEMIESGKNGVLVPPGDWETLAGALEFLLANAEIRKKYGRAARAAAVSRWESNSISRKATELITSVAC